MLSQEELVLLNTLRQKIKSTLTFIQKREKILSTKEGEITIEIPSPLSSNVNNNEYVISINSYLMDSSGLPKSWYGKTLKNTLQKAINGIQYWSQLEQDAVPVALRDYE